MCEQIDEEAELERKWDENLDAFMDLNNSNGDDDGHKIHKKNQPASKNGYTLHLFPLIRYVHWAYAYNTAIAVLCVHSGHCSRCVPIIWFLFWTKSMDLSSFDIIYLYIFHRIVEI